MPGSHPRFKAESFGRPGATKRILVISPLPSRQQNAGSRARVYGMLMALTNTGHEEHFLHISAETGGDEPAMAACCGPRFLCLPYMAPPRGTPHLPAPKTQWKPGAIYGSVV